MSTSPDRQITNMDEQVALPRQNGELVFETPWEARAFGLAVALNEHGLYAWRDFSRELAAETARAEKHGMGSTYYERWLASLERLAVARGLITPEELDTRTAEYASGARDEHDEHHHGHATHHHRH